MSKQYNLVADQYDMSFQLSPYRLHIEAYSVFNRVGDVSNQQVLELATGTGFYARALRKQGAARVVGVDIAEQMIQIGQMAEQAEPLGIEYHVQDVAQFKSDTLFDLALAVYLLHYAPTKEALFAMCQAIANNIKPGGRFITYQLNPDISREPDYYLKEPGLILKVQGATPVDGEAMPFSAKIGDMVMPEITAYRWNKETVDAALQAAGFTDIHWSQPQLSAAGAEQYGAETFADYLRQPHALPIECVKQ
jgi:2-polyprenyl-3-methyl-5-hydroxy-6-metoxy-1,4-benzoquinol methylase